MRPHVFLLLCAMPILFFASSTTSARIPRVVNGIISQPGQWPFMAALYKVTNITTITRDLKFFCGAMVWDNQTILTAGHCVVDLESSEIAVYLGHVNRTVIDENYLFDVKKIIMHKQYNLFVNDIALLRLAKPINFTSFSQKIAPVPRQNLSQLVDPDRCITLGWGHTGRGSPSMHLREADVYLEGCYPHCMPDFKTIDAGDYLANKGICFGDSGSPLLCALANDVQSYSLVGIASTAFFTCRYELVWVLGTYTYVPHYLQWIEENAG